MQKINFSVYPPLKKLLDYLYSIQKKRRLWTHPAGVRFQKVQKVQRVQRVVVGACGASLDKTLTPLAGGENRQTGPAARGKYTPFGAGAPPFPRRGNFYRRYIMSILS